MNNILRAASENKSRSVVRNFGRVTDLLYTASCWCKARFSRASCRWPPQRNGRSRSTWSRSPTIEMGFSPDQSRQINHLAAGRSFGEGQDVDALSSDWLAELAFQSALLRSDGWPDRQLKSGPQAGKRAERRTRAGRASLFIDPAVASAPRGTASPH